MAVFHNAVEGSAESLWEVSVVLQGGAAAAVPELSRQVSGYE